MIKMFKFKSESKRKEFKECGDEANRNIANIIGPNPFYGLVDDYGDIIEVRRTCDGLNVIDDYGTVFWHREISAFLIEVESESDEIKPAVQPKYEQLLVENIDLRARLAKLENRVNRLERIV
ncbi:hypothetical protein Asfd1_146 [Aeromonas phage Asfd_1]|nr:hypothetical protein Asfd1_146 [Aeromonas phage Asfd_1]